jgi:peptide/nickel transport system ATP-binding protein
MTTEVAVMYLGRIVELAEAGSLFRDASHPYTKILLRSAMTIAPGAGIPDVHFDRSDPAYRQPITRS